MIKKTSNIKDVAMKAGVSATTVSAYLHKSAPIKKETAVKIKEAINELGYVPNYMARGLRQKKTYTIGLIVGNVLSQFYSVIAKAVEDTALKYGYNLILCNGDDDPKKEKKYLDILRSRVDGILLIPTGKNQDYINTLVELGMKIVLLDRLVENVNCDAVIIDNEKASYDAVKFIISQGYKRISIINGPDELKTGHERLEGYLKALKDGNIQKDENFIKIGNFKRETGIKHCEELLNLKSRPEAIFTTNLEITLGALIAIKKIGLKIPDDIAIVGFDDSETLEYWEPPITVVAQPVYDLGSISTELLVKNIERKSKKSKKVEIVTLSTIFKERFSTIIDNKSAK